MSDHGSFPPPGQEPYGRQPPPGQPPAPGQPVQQPGWQQPGWQQPPPGWRPGPGMLGAAHKPGAVPLRPLGLGDMFDGAFRIIRFNPRATVGGALLVAVVAMAVPLVATSALTATVGTSVDPVTGLPDGDGFVAALVSQLAGTLLLQVGLLLVTGLIAHVTHQAATGRRIGLGEAWAMTRGRRWRLIGLVVLVLVAYVVASGLWVASIALLVVSGTTTAVVVVYGVLSGLLVLVASVLLYVRVVLLATPALMLERIGVLEALARSWRLTRGQFWRVLGIALVTSLVVGIAAFVVALPVEIVGQVLAFASPERALLVAVAAQAIGTVVSTAFTSPFTAVVTTLQYLDQRMRKEAYDVTLMSEAGITGV